MKKILFIQELEFEFLGVMYISAVLKKAGHITKLIFINRTNNILNEIQKFNPDVVAASVMTGLHKSIINCFQLIKNNFKNIKTLAGGPHPTFFPEMLNHSSVDAICLGEGELSINEFVEKIDNIRKNNIPDIPNFWIKNSQSQVIKCSSFNQYVQNLDSLPFPDRNIYYEHKFMLNIPTRAIISSRGCPYKCNFCFNEKYTGLFGIKNYCRFRSSQNIVAEMKDIIVRYPTNNFHFMDDTFLMNKKWLNDFLKTYREEINLPFICLGTANVIDEESVKELKKSKCHSIFFGIESGNEDFRINILNKKITNEQIINSAKILKKHKLPFKTFNILGFPGETLEQCWETIFLNVKIKTDYPWCALFAPYPGTKLTDYAIEIQELDSDFSYDEIPESFHKVSILKNKDIKKIQNLHKFFQTTVLFPWTIPFIKKIINFKPNILFDYWFGFIYFMVYFRAENRSFIKTFLFGLKNLKFLIKRK